MSKKSLVRSFTEFADWWEEAGLPFPPSARAALFETYTQTYNYTMGLTNG